MKEEQHCLAGVRITSPRNKIVSESRIVLLLIAAGLLAGLAWRPAANAVRSGAASVAARWMAGAGTSAGRLAVTAVQADSASVSVGKDLPDAHSWASPPVHAMRGAQERVAGGAVNSAVLAPGQARASTAAAPGPLKAAPAAATQSDGSALITAASSASRQAKLTRGLAGRSEGGLLVEQVPPGSLPEQLGLRAGDVILGINGDRISSLEQFAQMYDQGRPRQIELLRDGRVVHEHP